MRIFLVFLLCFLFRIIPHPPNFTAAFALSLWLGIFFRDRPAYWILSLVPMIAADLVLGSHTLVPLVYGCLVFTSWLGHHFGRRAGVKNLALCSFLSSTSFFLLVNFGVWHSTDMYAPTATGLLSCYFAALPFHGNQIASTFLFSTLFTKLAMGNEILVPKTSSDNTVVHG